MKCMIYGSKYVTILKIAVPGRVGMEECSLYLFLFKLRGMPFGFLVGGQGMIFSDNLN